MAIKIDLPFIAGNGESPLLIDGSHSFSIQVDEGNGYTWTERYAQLKDYFTPLPLKQTIVEDGEDVIVWTQSNIRPGYYLSKEQNFRNIGGGFFEWDRIYANIPSTWSETAQMAFNYIIERTVSGVLSQTNRSIPVSTKIEHSYQLGYPGNLEAQNLSTPVYTSESNTVAAGTFVRPVEVVQYLGDIWEIRKYTTLTAFNTA